MREIGHVAKGHLVPRLIHVGMKTFPVARELPAFGMEERPARLAGDRVDFLLVCAAVVVENNIGNERQAVLVRILDERQQIGLVPEPGWDRAFLVELTQVVIIVGIVAHRGAHQVRGLVDRRQPERAEPGLCQRRDLLTDRVPPLEFPALSARTVPVKSLQHDAHDSLLCDGVIVADKKNPAYDRLIN